MDRMEVWYRGNGTPITISEYRYQYYYGIGWRNKKKLSKENPEAPKENLEAPKENKQGLEYRIV